MCFGFSLEHNDKAPPSLFCDHPVQTGEPQRNAAFDNDSANTKAISRPRVTCEFSLFIWAIVISTSWTTESCSGFHYLYIAPWWQPFLLLCYSFNSFLQREHPAL
jgi:hypothetical protein